MVGEGRQVRHQDLRHLSSAGAGGADVRRGAALHPLPLHVPDVRGGGPAGGGQAVRAALEALPAEGRGRVPPAAQVQRVFQPGGGRCEWDGGVVLHIALTVPPPLPLTQRTDHTLYIYIY